MTQWFIKHQSNDNQPVKEQVIKRTMVEYGMSCMWSEKKLRRRMNKWEKKYPIRWDELLTYNYKDFMYDMNLIYLAPNKKWGIPDIPPKSARVKEVA